MKRRKRNWKFIISYTLCVVIGIFVLHTAFWIEYWNIELGGFLPRQLPEEGNPKWRWSHQSREHHEWTVRSRNIEYPEGTELFDPTVVEPFVKAAKARQLTEEEEHEIQVSMRRAYAENSLHYWVAVPGLFQHLLAPLSVGWLLLLAPWRRRWYTQVVLWILLFTSSCSIFLMLHRGYLLSLGW